MIENDISLRPLYLKDYIGQKDLKDNLAVYIEASKIRHEILDHCLFYGPSGLGKTTLAHIIANETKGNIKEVSAPSIERTGDLAAILSNLAPGDVLFIDEIHALDKTIEEILYSAMEDYKLNIVLDHDSDARQLSIQLPPFVLVGATTKIANISTPLRDRFGICMKLDYYNPTDLSLIIKRSSNILGLKIDDESCLEIAKRSRGVPRIANNILKRIRDFATIEKLKILDIKNTCNFLRKLKLDNKGLNDFDRLYLETIQNKFHDGPVGIELLSNILGESINNIEENTESFLLKLGFINRTPKGRVITKLAKEHLNKIKNEN